MNYLSKQTMVKQKGAALIVLVLAFLMATSVLVISNYSIDKGRIGLEKKTSQSLAKAKEALLSYAVSYYERNNPGEYGFLPCPEMATSAGIEGNELGNCAGQHEHAIGRLPWKTLNTEPIKDSSGECLWYAVSGAYKNVNAATKSAMLNEDTVGMFQIKDEKNNFLKGVTPEDRVVAVIISPGSALSGQNRPTTVPSDPNIYCKVNDADANNNITEYLESVGIDDNATLDDPELLDTFITASSQKNKIINDRIISITRKEIYSAIKKSDNFMIRMNVLTEAIAVCAKDYTLNNDVVPGGGCNLADCLQDCSDEQTVCHDQCYACSIQCDLDYNACLLVDTKKNCDKALKNCNKACPKENKCVKDCDKVFNSCENVCNTNCTPGGGGGGGGNNFWLPWPSPVDISINITPQNDYRIDTNYDDNNSNILPAGRLPYLIDDSKVNTGNPTADIFANCTNINATLNSVNGIDLSTENDEYRMLWRHWKDHFFYAIGSGFEPSNATATATPDCAAAPAACVEVYDTATATSSYYAGIVVYSGSPGVRIIPPIKNQLRQASPPEPAVVPGVDSKGDLDNYLETYDAVNSRFEFSSGRDSDDIAYCISSDNPMVISKCSP